MGQFQFLINELSTKEKLQLMEELWESLRETPAAIPSPEWHKDELMRRKENLKRNPESGKRWEDVKANLERYKRTNR